MINIHLDYSATLPICRKLASNAQNIESLIEGVTDTHSPITKKIILAVSDEIKHIDHYKTGDLSEALKKILDEIENKGEYPWNYRDVKTRAEDLFDEKNKEIENDLFDGIAEQINNEESSWVDWAEEMDYPEIASQIKELNGKYKASRACVSVEYNENTRVITLYRNVLGCDSEWMKAFALGVFHAYYSDIKRGVTEDIVLYALSGWFERYYLVYELNEIYAAGLLEVEWKSTDMKYWPYSAALYLVGIDFPLRRFGSDYLFKRTFRRCTKDVSEAYKDIMAAYRLYEGRDFNDSSVKKVIANNTIAGQLKVFNTFGHGSARKTATAIYENGKLTVLAGSPVSDILKKSFGGSVKKLRDELDAKGQIVNHVLECDVTFDSVSAAAIFVRGVSNDGWLSWVDENGTTLDELVRK